MIGHLGMFIHAYSYGHEIETSSQGNKKLKEGGPREGPYIRLDSNGCDKEHY